MERKKGDLLLSWQKKPVGIYLGDIAPGGGFEYYNFGRSMVVYIPFKLLKVLFYTEDSFKGVDLSGADLRGANLRDANLRDADLRWADLRRATLRNSNLRGANLRGAILAGANLEGANLYGAKYDKGTVWPEGFKS